MAETITATPLRVSNSATKPMRRMLMSLSSLLKLRPLERLVRTTSPSRTSTRWPLSLSSFSTISLVVVFPDPERPVNHSVKPRSFSGVRPYSFFIASSLIHRFQAEVSGDLANCASQGRRGRHHDVSRSPSMRTSTTSGRENSGGGYSPLESISLTLVPEKKTWEEGSCGHVLAEAIPMHS